MGDGKLWFETVKPLLTQHGPAEADAKGVWVAAVAGDLLKATVFTKTVVDRELSQRDLAQWLQRLGTAGRDHGSLADFPLADIEKMPAVPDVVEELAGPKGFLAKLVDNALKS